MPKLDSLKQKFDTGVLLMDDWFHFRDGWDKDESSRGQKLIDEAADSGYVPALIKKEQIDERNATIFKCKSLFDSVRTSEPSKQNENKALVEGIVETARGAYKDFYELESDYTAFAAMAMVESCLNDPSGHLAPHELLEEWIEKAIDSGVKQAGLLHAIYLIERLDGNDSSAVTQVLKDYLEEAADNGDPDMCLLIGKIHCDSGSLDQGILWFDKAIASGSKFAEYNRLLASQLIAAESRSTNSEKLGSANLHELLKSLNDLKILFKENEGMQQYPDTPFATNRMFRLQLGSSATKWTSHIEYLSILVEAKAEGEWSEQLISKLVDLQNRDSSFKPARDCLWVFWNLPEFQSQRDVLGDQIVGDSVLSGFGPLPMPQREKPKVPTIISNMLESFLPSMLVGVLMGILPTIIVLAIVAVNVDEMMPMYYLYVFLGVPSTIALAFFLYTLPVIFEDQGEKDAVQNYNDQIINGRKILASRMQPQNLIKTIKMVGLEHVYAKYEHLVGSRGSATERIKLGRSDNPSWVETQLLQVSEHLPKL